MIGVFRTQLNIYDEVFRENSERLLAVYYSRQKKKGSIVEIRLVSKYASNKYYTKNASDKYYTKNQICINQSKFKC